MRVLLVDDHRVMRLGLRSLLEQTDDIEVVGEAGNAARALKLVEELAPDLVVLDLRLEGETSGIEACREMKALPTPPRVLIHTAYNTAEDFAAATLAGADGYVHKGLERADMAEALRRVYTGEHVWLLTVAPEEAERKLEQALAGARLTRREREVLALVVRRYSNVEIANRLQTSLNTTKNQVSSILRKLGVGSRKDLFWSP